MTTKQRSTPYLLRLLSDNRLIYYHEDQWCSLSQPIVNNVNNSVNKDTLIKLIGREFIADKLNHTWNLNNINANITSPRKSDFKSIQKLTKILSDWEKLENKIK